MVAMRRNQALGCSIYEPTPLEIRRACVAIQATWSPRERAERYRRTPATWWLPSTDQLSDLIVAMNAGNHTASEGRDNRR
jgi:hypothetical protein